jgi:hypothetical protein
MKNRFAEFMIALGQFLLMLLFGVIVYPAMAIYALNWIFCTKIEFTIMNILAMLLALFTFDAIFKSVLFLIARVNKNEED